MGEKTIRFGLPDGIREIIDTIENAGGEVYITGGSLRDLLLEKMPLDWDLSTTMLPEAIKELFPETDLAGERYGVIGVAWKDGETAKTAEIATLRTEAGYTDHRRPDRVDFTTDLAADLARRDFTVNAMAYSGARGVVDPFDGQKALASKLIKVVGDPRERFEEDPLRIMRGIRLAAQLDFDVEMITFEAMVGTSHLLEEISIQRRREEFEKILMAPQAGKGLRMCAAAGVMNALTGGRFPPKGRSENGDMETLLQKIDKAKKRLVLRMALFLLCFPKKDALEIIDELKYDNKTTKLLKAAQTSLTDLFFATGGYEVKRFIYLNGEEIYDFLNDISKCHRDVYDSSEIRIESRYYILQEIRANKEPIFVEDLVIDGDDLVKEGIASGAQVGELLNLLIDVVHRYPGLNTRPKLLKKAKELKKPWKAKTRNIYWLR